jgi:hypothetical protein
MLCPLTNREDMQYGDYWLEAITVWNDENIYCFQLTKYTLVKGLVSVAAEGTHYQALGSVEISSSTEGNVMLNVGNSSYLLSNKGVLTKEGMNHE